MLHGQEIYLFFYRFGLNGIWGIIVCNIIMAIVIYKTLNIIYMKNINDYKDFLSVIFDGNIKLINITNIIINIFLCATFFIMISGFGTYLSQAFNINQILGSCILAVISYAVFLRNIEGLAKINSIIIPILILVIVIIGIINIFNMNFENISINKDTSIFWLVQAILYASYNLILVEPVLINLKKMLKSKKQIIMTSVGVGINMFILTLLEFFLLTHLENLRTSEMPLITVIQHKFSNFTLIYGTIILIAIFTTATSLGISFLNNICKNKKSFPQIAAILCITSVIVSPIGFSNLVNNLFPLFGFLGLIEIFYCIKYKS